MKNKIALYSIAISLSITSGISFATNNDTSQYHKKHHHTAKQKTSLNQAHETANLQKQVKQNAERNKRLEAEVQNLNEKVAALEKEKVVTGKVKEPTPPTLSNIAPRFTHGLAVVSSPFLGERDLYSPYDLVVNYSSLNEDLTLMKQRQRLENYAKAHGEPLPDRPLVDISGDVEGKYIYNHDYVGPSQQDLDLTEAKAIFVGEISKWVTADLTFEYENEPPVTGARYTNSETKLSRAFLTIGNLNENPLYFTLGQIYVPFGTYTSYTISDPVTETLARIKARAAQLGFYQSGLNVSAFAFKDDTYVSNPHAINTWGTNFSYSGDVEKFGYKFGAGYISNIADSMGMQQTYGSFLGFGHAVHLERLNEQLHNYVPAADLNANLSYGRFVLLGEYVRTLRSFNVQDLSFNNHGAMPTAGDLELAYNFSILGKEATAVIDGGFTHDALAINLPQKTAAASVAVSIWKYSIESLEFRHDRNYASTDSASGMGLPSFSPSGFRDRNVVTAKIGVYF